MSSVNTTISFCIFLIQEIHPNTFEVSKKNKKIVHMETKMIGSKIAKARKEINMSQAELAQRLFISPQAVGKWERGESMPDITTFNRLAEILGVDLNYFSESFQSEAGEVAPVEPLVKGAGELSSGKQEKKLSWDMSSGNWVDADFSGLKNLHEKFSSSNMQRCLLSVQICRAFF
jgi:transcriptional regulator with XRE-family HTH domain